MASLITTPVILLLFVIIAAIFLFVAAFRINKDISSPYAVIYELTGLMALNFITNLVIAITIAVIFFLATPEAEAQELQATPRRDNYIYISPDYSAHPWLRDKIPPNMYLPAITVKEPRIIEQPNTSTQTTRRRYLND